VAAAVAEATAAAEAGATWAAAEATWAASAAVTWAEVTWVVLAEAISQAGAEVTLTAEGVISPAAAFMTMVLVVRITHDITGRTTAPIE
jgi:hypothetical protein